MDIELLPKKKREDSSEGRKFRRIDVKEEEPDHLQIPVPKRNWVYKLEPTTIEENDRERDFIFVIPYCFATAATPEALQRGLLQTIEFRQEDECISAVRMTFNNGTQQQ